MKSAQIYELGCTGLGGSKKNLTNNTGIFLFGGKSDVVHLGTFQILKGVVGQVGGERDQSKGRVAEGFWGSESILCTQSSNKQGTHRLGEGSMRPEEWKPGELCFQAESPLTNVPGAYQLRSQGCFFRLVLCLNWDIHLYKQDGALLDTKVWLREKVHNLRLWIKGLGLWGHLPGCKKGQAAGRALETNKSDFQTHPYVTFFQKNTLCN